MSKSHEVVAVGLQRNRRVMLHGHDKEPFPMNLSVLYWKVGTIPADTVTVGRSDDQQRAVHEAILKILNRDSKLRRTYLQRRWQGLDEYAQERRKTK